MLGLVSFQEVEDAKLAPSGIPRLRAGTDLRRDRSTARREISQEIPSLRRFAERIIDTDNSVIKVTSL